MASLIDSRTLRRNLFTGNFPAVFSFRLPIGLQRDILCRLKCFNVYGGGACEMCYPLWLNAISTYLSSDDIGSRSPSTMQCLLSKYD